MKCYLLEFKLPSPHPTRAVCSTRRHWPPFPDSQLSWSRDIALSQICLSNQYFPVPSLILLLKCQQSPRFVLLSFPVLGQLLPAVCPTAIPRLLSAGESQFSVSSSVQPMDVQTHTPSRCRTGCIREVTVLHLHPKFNRHQIERVCMWTRTWAGRHSREHTDPAWNFPLSHRPACFN